MVELDYLTGRLSFSLSSRALLDGSVSILHLSEERLPMSNMSRTLDSPLYFILFCSRDQRHLPNFFSL